MSTESQIITEIESIVENAYSSWTIGITEDPNRSRIEHGNPGLWRVRDAITESSARKIEQHFRAKGMLGTADGGPNSHYVYIM